MRKYTFFIGFFIGFCGSALFAQDEQVQRLIDSYKDDRRYDEVCFLTAHNAYSSSAEGWKILKFFPSYVQQALSFDDQFAYGVRSFMIDLYWHKLPSAEPYIALCHQTKGPEKTKEILTADTNCELNWMLRSKDPQTALDFFKHVANWLGKDKQAIITVHLESYLGADSKDALFRLFEEAGVADYLYLSDQHYSTELPNKPLSWPTLGELRTNRKRLIIFSDNPSDGVISVGAYRETKFDLKACPNAEMRLNGRAWPTNSIIQKDNQRRFVFEVFSPSQLLLLNHFYSATSPRHYPVVNNCEDIMRRVNLCYKQEDHLPNFIAVDFVEEGLNGGARQAVTMLNELPPENFGSFKGYVQPAVPFSTIGFYDRWASALEDNIISSFQDHPVISGVTTAGVGATAAAACYYCCKHGVRPKPKVE